MRTPIKLKFGTLKGVIKANLSTNFGRYPINIHGVMCINKIISNFYRAYRINRFENSVKRWSVVRVTIMGVPFSSLKEIKVKTMKIDTTQKPPVCNRSASNPMDKGAGNFVKSEIQTWLPCTIISNF